MRQTNVRGTLSLRGFRKLRTGAIVATGVILLGLGFLAPTVSASEQDGVWVARTVAEVKADIQKEGVQLTQKLEQLEKNIDMRNSDVAGKKETLKSLTADIGKFQQQLEKANLDLATAETEIRSIQDNFRDTHSRDLMEFEQRMLTITAPAAEIREKLSSLRQALRDLGSVNLMAPEEFAETKERFDFSIQHDEVDGSESMAKGTMIYKNMKVNDSCTNTRKQLEGNALYIIARSVLIYADRIASSYPEYAEKFANNDTELIGQLLDKKCVTSDKMSVTN